MSRFYIFFLCLVLCSRLFAQPVSRGDFSGLPADGVLTGKVIDQADGLPMEYVNVVVYSHRDSSIVNGIITSIDGRFRLENLPYGRHYAEVNFIGYDKIIIPEIRINPRQKEVDLGTIDLSPSVAEIEGIIVSAERVHVEYKIDKKVVNVSQDLVAAGNTAIEVLENTPSVQVDIEGNVTLRGSTQFTVLIDGRPSVLKGSDALQQIPASTIEQIEIITNPSARYDPDGVGGIINVVLKKQKRPGVNGVVNLSVGSKNKYRGDVLLEYRTKDVNVFGGLDYSYHDFSMQGRNEYESFLPDYSYYRNSDFNGKMNRNGFGLKGGVDYFVNEKNTTSLSGRYGGFGFTRNMDASRHIFYIPDLLPDEYSASLNQMDRDGNFYEVNLGHLYQFDKKGHQIEFLAFYSARNSDNKQYQEEYLTDPNGVNIDDSPDKLQIPEGNDGKDARIKIDYTRPFGEKGKIEAGYQSRFESQTETFQYFNWDDPTSQWVENMQYANEADFNRNIHAVYGIFANSSGIFGYQAGLRGEYTDRSIESVRDNATYAINRFDIFPTIHISMSLDPKNQILASYGRRIYRPNSRQLDPFVFFFDPYNIRKGNPALNPEFIDSYELSYQRRFKSGFVSFETYYRVTDNKITTVRQMWDEDTEIVMQTFQNLNKDFSLGTELMVNLTVTKWLDFNGSVNLYDYRLEGSVEGIDVSTGSTNWDGRLNGTIKFPADIRGQITFIYRSPSATAQGEIMESYMTNIAVRKDFLNRKMNVILSVRDVFSTGKRESITNGIGFYSYDYFKRESPVVNLSLSYIINNYKRQRNGSQRGDDAGRGDMDMDF